MEKKIITLAEQRLLLELEQAPTLRHAFASMTQEEASQAKLMFIGTVVMCMKDYALNRGIFDPNTLNEWVNLYHETNPVQKL